jgi:hypothetical protein
MSWSTRRSSSSSSSYRARAARRRLAQVAREALELGAVQAHDRAGRLLDVAQPREEALVLREHGVRVLPEGRRVLVVDLEQAALLLQREVAAHLCVEDLSSFRRPSREAPSVLLTRSRAVSISSSSER